MSEPVYLNRWQPIILVLDKRLECECGALASIISGVVAEKHPEKHTILEKGAAWCQTCYEQWQRENNE